jgi:hypothetical protein
LNEKETLLYLAISIGYCLFALPVIIRAGLTAVPAAARPLPPNANQERTMTDSSNTTHADQTPRDEYWDRSLPEIATGIGELVNSLCIARHAVLGHAHGPEGEVDPQATESIAPFLRQLESDACTLQEQLTLYIMRHPDVDQAKAA